MHRLPRHIIDVDPVLEAEMNAPLPPAARDIHREGPYSEQKEFEILYQAHHSGGKIDIGDWEKFLRFCKYADEREAEEAAKAESRWWRKLFKLVTRT